MEEKINIMHVEDSLAYRKVILRALGEEPYIGKITQFGTAEVALRSLLDSKNQHPPDIILLDLSLPGMSGIEAIPHFIREGGSPKIIMLTQSDAEPDVLKAISLGAAGYLLKSATSQQLKDAIKTVINGGAPLDASVSKFVFAALKERVPKVELDKDLSEREMDTLKLLAQGLSRKEIADHLGIGTSTVVTHLNRIYLKLEVPNAPAAIDKAYRSGLL
jgi:two-component system nitrate/nitrite response regulator NarL